MGDRVFTVADLVSTHSRLKAAGGINVAALSPSPCFNTQPPEGGCQRAVGNFFQAHGFNTQPPEGGWAIPPLIMLPILLFQHTAA